MGVIAALKVKNRRNRWPRKRTHVKCREFSWIRKTGHGSHATSCTLSYVRLLAKHHNAVAPLASRYISNGPLSIPAAARSLAEKIAQEYGSRNAPSLNTPRPHLNRESAEILLPPRTMGVSTLRTIKSDLPPQNGNQD